jgi:hypothetical protein
MHGSFFTPSPELFQHVKFFSPIWPLNVINPSPFSFFLLFPQPINMHYSVATC